MVSRPSAQLRCHYFESGACRSCTLIETPYDRQLADAQERCRELLPQVPAAAWLPVSGSADRGFRNRAKLVVGGSPARVSLGILGPDGRGVDLRECAIQSPEIAAVIPTLAAFLERTGLPPYDVPGRRGEVKFVHVTSAPDGALMLRFVVRSERALEVLRGRLDELRRLVPQAEVISVNLLPEHKAVLEGEREEVLHGSALAMRLGTQDRPLTLYLQPRSFFQTNTGVARELYAQAVAWAERGDPASVWDLYCGVGGFALHIAAALGGAREVLGIEISEAAVDAARRSAREAGVSARFVAADATEFAVSGAGAGASATTASSAPSGAELPELLVGNPPRRGLGAPLAEWVEGSGIPSVIYSSCNPVSLARDLVAMPSYQVDAARVFDMFPHTSHLEVTVLLSKSA